MPYIPEFRRHMVKVEGPANSGELCYSLYKACLDYVGGAGSFTRYAEVLGALEATKHELYRRHVGPYEDGAIERNGNV